MTTIQQHIVRAENGTLYVAGTPYKVKLLLREHVGWGLSAQQLCEGHAGLTLADAHAVLAYFYDNEQELKREMDEDLKEADALRSQFPNNFTRQELLQRLQDPGAESQSR